MKAFPSADRLAEAEDTAERKHSSRAVFIKLGIEPGGWKKATLPNISSGKPRYAKRLDRSDVFREFGRVRVEALFAKGGDPQSSKFLNKSDTSVSSAPDWILRQVRHTRD